MAKTKSATPPPPGPGKGPKAAPSAPPPPAQIKLRELAEAIGVDSGQLAREAKRPGFPQLITPSGRRRYIAADVIAWRARNVRLRTTGKPPSSAAPPAPASRPSASAQAKPPAPRVKPAAAAGRLSLAGKGDRFIRAMMSGDADPLTISRAAMQMASRRVANAAVDGTLGVSDLDGLKKTLQELRAAEADYDAMQIARRELVTIAEVEAVVGQSCSRLVRCLGVLENSIETEVELWIADPKIRALPVDDRKRIVRAFVARVCHQIREQEAKGARKLMAEMAAEDGAGA